MELYSIKGGNTEDLHNKQYTIGVGISLGNKWFTVENIAELVKWSFQYTKDYVIVYVADSIHAINIEVRKSCSKEKALSDANKLGDKILKETKGVLEKILSNEEITKVKFIKWNEIIDSNYQKKLDYIYSKYNNDLDFRNQIFTIVKNMTDRESRPFTDEKIYRLGEYLIEELPEVIVRTPIGGIICDAYVYPYTGEFVDFVDKIQRGEIFPEIRDNILDTGPKVFLEVR